MDFSRYEFVLLPCNLQCLHWDRFGILQIAFSILGTEMIHQFWSSVWILFCFSAQYNFRMFTICFFELTHPSATFFALNHSLSSTFFALRHSSAMSDFEQTDNNLRTNRQQISTTKHFQNTIDQDEWRWQDNIF